MYCNRCGDPATIVARRNKLKDCSGGKVGKDYNLCSTCLQVDRECWSVRVVYSHAKMQKNLNQQTEMNFK